MRKKSKQFLYDIMNTPSLSGYEQPVQAIVREYAEGFADEVYTDVHGNVIATKNPAAPVRVMVEGHCDQVGLMIQNIDDSGMLHIATIGGVEPETLVAHVVTVHTANGPVPGVIGRKPIHLLSPEERESEKLKVEDLWLDIGAKDKATAEKLVEIGDPATFRLQWVPLQQDLISSPGCDDKAGVFVAMEALRLVPTNQLSCAVYAVSTVQEEIGLRGAKTSAFGIDPHASITVEVTHATDYPGVDEKRTGKIEMCKGPGLDRGANINPVLRDILIKAAKERDIIYQTLPQPAGAPNNANFIQVSRSGVATAIVRIPNRYMHTPVEIISLGDLDNAVKIVTEALTHIDENTDFTPM